MSLRHSKETVEVTRVDNLKDLKQKYENREAELAEGIEALQVRYSKLSVFGLLADYISNKIGQYQAVTVKELEDLVEVQKKHIDKLRTECKTLNEQLEILVLRYKNDTHSLSSECEELKIRLSKYEKRLAEFEEHNLKHLNLHEKMKNRLKEMTVMVQEQQEEVSVYTDC